jgi:hypothetical protein
MKKILSKSIRGTIQDITLALQAGVHPTMLKLGLVSEGWTIQRAALMVRWAQQSLIL